MALEPLYDLEAVRPMYEELEEVGVQSLKTPEEVDQFMQRGGTALLVVNSVCGCAAGGARPGVMLALQHKTIPDHLGTVFAGIHREAVEHARDYMKNVPPSSPCVALFRDGELKHVLPRQAIEQMSAEMLAANLAEAFDDHCGRPGPSVPQEQYEKAQRGRICGSKIPLYRDGA